MLPGGNFAGRLLHDRTSRARPRLARLGVAHAGTWERGRSLGGKCDTSDNRAGTTFRFEDDLDDVWGEVSAGVNFFNPSASTAVFAKVDVTFGDDVDGIGGKAGMRVSW